MAYKKSHYLEKIRTYKQRLAGFFKRIGSYAVNSESNNLPVQIELKLAV